MGVFECGLHSTVSRCEELYSFGTCTRLGFCQHEYVSRSKSVLCLSIQGRRCQRVTSEGELDNYSELAKNSRKNDTVDKRERKERTSESSRSSETKNRSKSGKEEE